MTGPYVDGTKTDALMQDAALAPTPVADAPGLTPALASTGQEMRTGQPRARYGGRMNADGGLAWNAQNDQMMPGGTQIRESRTAWNDPLFGNTGQVLPHAHLANQLQGKKLERAKQRAEIKKKLENWDPTAGIPEVAPAYQEDLNKYVASQFEDAYRAAVDLNGGDEQAAQLALSNPNSAEGRAWKAIVDDATVVARKANFVTNDAIATMKAMDDGDAEYIQEVYDAADASVRAMKNGGNVRALANGMEQYQVVKEWNSFLKEKGIAEQLQKTDWSKETLNIPKGRDRNGMLVYETIGMGDPRMKDAIIRQTMMTVPPKYHKIYGEDGLYQRLERLLSANITSEAKIIDPYHAPTGSGDGAGGKPKAFVGGWEQGVSSTIPEPTEGSQWLGRKNLPVFLRGNVDRAPLMEVVGGRNVPMGPRPFTDENGNPVTIKSPQFERNSAGDLFITGEMVGDAEETSRTYKNENGDEVTETVKKSSKTPSSTGVMVKGNEAKLDEYAPGWREQVGYETSAGKKTTSIDLDKGTQKVYKYNPATGQIE